MSAEVLTIFNQSNLPQKLKGTAFCKANLTLIFAHVCEVDFKIVPPDGVVAGTKIAVADSAYARSTIDAEVPLYLPTKLPSDGSNPKVRENNRFLHRLSFSPKRAPI